MKVTIFKIKNPSNGLKWGWSIHQDDVMVACGANATKKLAKLSAECVCITCWGRNLR